MSKKPDEYYENIGCAWIIFAFFAGIALV